MDNKLKIINYLGKNLDESFTMHQLSKILNIPYATFCRTLNLMQDLVVIKRVGKSKTVRADLKNPVIKSYFVISSNEEKKEYLEKQPIIRKITNELETEDIVVLFGSYAKGSKTEKSDIDLLVINKDGKRTLSFSKYEMLFKKKINPIFITNKEFRLMLKDKEENVGKQALKNHVILNNHGKFWEAVLDAI